MAVSFAALALSQAWSDGPTVDEGTYLVSGLTAWTHHDLRVNRQTAPLGKMLAALPVLAAQPQIPGGRAWRDRNERALTAEWVRSEQRAHRLRLLVFLGRLVPITLTLATAFVLAMLANELFGAPAGAFASVLWLASPLVIGLGHLNGVDVPATLSSALVVLAVARSRRAHDPGSLWIVGVAGAVAILARATGLLVVLAALAVVVAASWPDGIRTVARRVATVAGTAWAVLAGAYLVLDTRAIRSPREAVPIVTSAVRVAIPPDWWGGLRYLSRIGTIPGPSFLVGHAHMGRWLAFWPIALVVKLPPGTLVVLVALPWSLSRIDVARRKEAIWVLGPTLIALTVFTLQQERPIGVRYLLPAFALAVVAASSLVTGVAGRARAAIWTAVVAVGAVCCLALPSLSWTLPIFGTGYRTAADSDLDWGQSLPVLDSWSASHHPWVEYFGVAGIGADQISGARALRLAPSSLTGWVAVSASDLTVYDRKQLSWLRAYCPVGVLDRTILLYHFSTPPNRRLVGADAPPPVCSGATSHRVTAPAHGIG